MVVRIKREATAGAVAELECQITALVCASGVGRPANEGRNAVAEFEARIASAKADGAR